jgi:hypothetical protein
MRVHLLICNLSLEVAIEVRRLLLWILKLHTYIHTHTHTHTHYIHTYISHCRHIYIFSIMIKITVTRYVSSSVTRIKCRNTQNDEGFTFILKTLHQTMNNILITIKGSTPSPLPPPPHDREGLQLKVSTCVRQQHTWLMNVRVYNKIQVFLITSFKFSPSN